MKTYAELDRELTGRCSKRRKVGNNTYAERRDNGDIAIKLHETDILTFRPSGEIVARTGGWKTHTTKDRLNQYLPIVLWQKSGRWFCGHNGSSVEFQDEITFHPDGSITGSKPQSDVEAEKLLQKRIKAYCNGLKIALPLPMPSNGDCWFCSMREVNTGNPLGECAKATSHLESHMDEKYYVPSLVWRALEFSGCNPHGGGCAYFAFAFGDSKPGDWQAKAVAKMVRKYLRRQFGLA